MPNLRIVYNNAADRATSLTASTTAGSLVAANMQTDYKTKVHRSTGTSVTYTLTWNIAEVVGAVALPATNLTASATIRVRLYSDTAGTALIADSGTVFAAPGTNLQYWDWSQTLNQSSSAFGGNVNTFAFGGYSKTAVWFENQVANVKACVIDLVDTTNTTGYIDCSRIIVGGYWEPTFNAENGVQVEIVDTSTTSRSEAGDLVVDRDILHEKLNFNFSLLPENDRNSLMKIIRLIGTSKNILVCLFPNDSNTQQDFMIYGKRTNGSVNYEVFSFYKHSMEIIGW